MESLSVQVLVEPSESELTMQAARLALSGIDIPVLGVCLGHQALALADGKNVVRSKKGPVHGQPVKVEHDGSGIFAGQESPMTLTRYNSLIVEGKKRDFERICLVR